MVPSGACRLSSSEPKNLCVATPACRQCVFIVYQTSVSTPCFPSSVAADSLLDPLNIRHRRKVHPPDQNPSEWNLLPVQEVLPRYGTIMFSFTGVMQDFTAIRLLSLCIWHTDHWHKKFPARYHPCGDDPNTLMPFAINAEEIISPAGKIFFPIEIEAYLFEFGNIKNRMLLNAELLHVSNSLFERILDL
jgi:hypothetical protein